MTQETSNYRHLSGQAPIPKPSQASYPLARCPKCRHGFREEITGSEKPGTELCCVTCPHCGHKFQRFSLARA